MRNSIITDFALLSEMAQAGHITLHETTEQDFSIFGGFRRFNHNGVDYEVYHLIGKKNPYVYQKIRWTSRPLPIPTPVNLCGDAPYIGAQTQIIANPTIEEQNCTEGTGVYLHNRSTLVTYKD